MLPIPSLSQIKIGVAIATLVIIAGMGLYIKYQAAKLEAVSVKLETSELNNKQLNNTITMQNEAIIASNKKYDQVQKQLTEANGLNKALSKEFKALKQSINKNPVPQTCEEARVEMISVGKAIGKKWKN